MIKLQWKKCFLIEMSCYNVEMLENLYLKSYCNILITSSKKRDKVSIANIF